MNWILDNPCFVCNNLIGDHNLDQVKACIACIELHRLSEDMAERHKVNERRDTNQSEKEVPK